MGYAIKNKQTGEFFSGFKNNEATWGTTPYVWGDKLHAQCQASLFLCVGIPAQRKAIEVSNG